MDGEAAGGARIDRDTQAFPRKGGGKATCRRNDGDNAWCYLRYLEVFCRDSNVNSSGLIDYIPVSQPSSKVSFRQPTSFGIRNPEDNVNNAYQYFAPCMLSS